MSLIFHDPLCVDVKQSDGDHAFKDSLRNSLSRLLKNVTLRRLGRKYSYKQHQGLYVAVLFSCSITQLITFSQHLASLEIQ